MNPEKEEIDSEDEAPEDVSLSQAKVAAQERTKHIKDSIQVQKAKAKEYRRERQKKQVEQKQVKHEKSLVKLPDDVINVLMEVDSAKSGLETGKKEEEEMEAQTITTTLENQEKHSSKKRRKVNADESAKRTKEEPVEGFGNESEEDTDSKDHSITGPKSVPKALTVKQKLASVESKGRVGKQFLKEHMYGNRITRVAASSFENLQTKKHIRPSANF